jgi:hypothetical protein
MVTSAETARLLTAQAGECPDVQVSVNGMPVTIDFDDGCAFVIDDVQPAPLVEVRVALVDLGVAGTITLRDVGERELIEILVEPTENSLTVSMERRTTPQPSDGLPAMIDGNNISSELSAGVFAQNLTVSGNNFTLVGEAGQSCDDRTGWTVIEGEVLVIKNNATFRNILFAGPVELRGNNARFINCCFGESLLVFANNADFGGHDGNDDNENDDEDDNDD